MCGILGGFSSVFSDDLESGVEAALNKINHRGPDDRGYEVYPIGKGSCFLGHTRLSIIDLTDAGHQPMVSSDGRFTLVFNGEIYNYLELRQELESIGVTFFTETDTEVLLQSWIYWGEGVLKNLEGMFSFSILDKKSQTLTCARDAFGIKPFFYCYEKGEFKFASEKPALISMLAMPSELDAQKCYDYLVHGEYDSGDKTLTKGVNQLKPAHLMVFDLEAGLLSEQCKWWNPSVEETYSGSFEDASLIVRDMFLQSVRKHLRSDVPVGSALSGGIDSSAIVCAMRYLEPQMPIHTFSFIAEGSDLSEEYWVDRVNSYVGAIPHKIIATGDELLADLESMISAQGEPFSTTSIYAQYRVFKAAKESGITVTLDGQGADEILAGYSGYPGQRIRSLLERHKVRAALEFLSNWSKWPGRNYKHAIMYFIQSIIPDALNKLARRAMGRNFSPDWLNLRELKSAGVLINEPRVKLSKEGKGRRVIEQLLLSANSRGLPGLLRHADRNSMHFSIESRVPFLSKKFISMFLVKN